MPANVQQSFERGVNALFVDAEPKKTIEPANVFKIWNTMASKFPKLYTFAEFSKRARTTEAKLLLFHKLDPRSEVDRGILGLMFTAYLETDLTNTLEDALDNWWKKVSHD
jgi:hypothetical protein